MERFDETMRVRCPKDTPREADRHTAIDVRLPLPMTALTKLMRALTRCACGEPLVVAFEPQEPVAGAPVAGTSERALEPSGAPCAASGGRDGGGL